MTRAALVKMGLVPYTGGELGTRPMEKGIWGLRYYKHLIGGQSPPLLLSIIGRRYLVFGLLFLFLSVSSQRESQAVGVPETNIVQAYKVLKTWDGSHPGDVAFKIKQLVPEVGVKDVIRILDKRFGPKDPSLRQAIKRYQSGLRQKVLEVRQAFFKQYVRRYPRYARSLYGFADIGSWSDTSKEMGPEADIDWTLLGVDPVATAHARDLFNRDLARAMKLPPDSNPALEFDVVVTPEGHEGASGVYENPGSKDWVKRNFQNFFIIEPTGRIVSCSSDVPKEIAMARQLAMIRKVASDYGVYEKVFDGSGHFIARNLDKISPEARAAINSIRDVPMEVFKARPETCPGATLEMAFHLDEEVLSQKEGMTPEALLDKINKYSDRGLTFLKLSHLPQEAIESDSVLGRDGDPALRKTYIEFMKRYRGLRKAALVEAYAGSLELADVSGIGERVREVLKRLSVIQFQYQAEAIFKIESMAERQRKIELLREGFSSGLTRQHFPELHRSFFETLQRIENTSKDPGRFKLVRDAIKKSKMACNKREKAPVVERLKGLLLTTSAGKRYLQLQKEVVEFKEKYGIGPMDTPTLEFIKHVRGKVQNMTDYLGRVSLWLDSINAVEAASTNTDMILALGKVIASNTTYGGIVAGLYHGISTGDPEQIARVFMFLIVPEAGIPDLVKAIGSTAGYFAKKIIFADQLEAFYWVSSFDQGGTLVSIYGYSVPELVDLIYQPGSWRILKAIRSEAMKKAGQGGSASFILEEAAEKMFNDLMYHGEPAIFPDFGPLVSATLTVKNLSKGIDDIVKATSTPPVPETVGPEWIQGNSSYPKGVRRAIEKILQARQAAWEQVKVQLGTAIKTSFEERYRAEKELSRGRDHALKVLAELYSIFDRLHVLDRCKESLNRRGTFNAFVSWFKSDAQEQRKAMEAVLKFKETYQGIADLRELIKTIHYRETGHYPVPEPFSSWPALVCEPEVDMKNALAFLEEYRQDVYLNRISTSELSLPYDHAECVKKWHTKTLDASYRALFLEFLNKNYEWLNNNKLGWLEALDSLNIAYIRNGLYSKSKRLYQELKRFREERKKCSDLSEGFKKFVKQAEAFEAEGRLKEAIETYKRALEFKKDKEIQGRIEALKARLYQAMKLRRQGKELVSRKEYKEAIKRFKKSLVFMPDKGLEAYIARLEALLEKGLGHRAPSVKNHSRVSEKEQQNRGAKGPSSEKKVHEKEDKAQQGGAWSDISRSKASGSSYWGAFSVTISGVEKDSPVFPFTYTFYPDKCSSSKQVLRCKDSKYSIRIELDKGFRNITQLSAPAPLFVNKDTVSGIPRTMIQTLPYSVPPGGCLLTFSKSVRKDVKPKVVDGRIVNETEVAASAMFDFGINIVIGLEAEACSKISGPGGQDGKLSLQVISTPERPWYTGQDISMEAKVKGGKSPYQYEWSGEVEAEGKRAVFMSTQAGRHVVTLVVTDAEGRRAKSRFEIDLRPLKPKVVGIRPGQKIVLGQKIGLRVDLPSNFSAKDLMFLWQPHESVDFSPFLAQAITARFYEPGRQPVWVSVLRRYKGADISIADSESVQVDVIPPKVRLKAETVPFVGEEGKVGLLVQADVAPEFLRILWSSEGKVAFGCPSSDDLHYRFVPGSFEQVNIYALTRSYEGVDLESAHIRIIPKRFKVKIKNNGTLGIKGQVWKEGKGLLERKDRINAFESVVLKASIEPEPKNKPLEFRWSCNEDTHFQTGDFSQEVMVYRNRRGTAVVTVEVFDRNDILLGADTVTFKVAAQEEDSGRSRKEAEAWFQKGKRLWSQGRLDEALKGLSRASALDKHNRLYARTLLQRQRQKAAIDRRLAEIQGFIDAGDLKKAKVLADKIPVFARNYEGYQRCLRRYTRAIEMLSRARQLIASGYRFEREGKLMQAIRAFKKGISIWPDKKIVAHVSRLEKDVEKARRLRNQGKVLLRQGRTRDALMLFEKSLKYFPDKGLERYIEKLKTSMKGLQEGSQTR